MDVRRRARVPGLPHARAAAEALRGGGARGARDAARSCARSRPTSRSRTSSRPRRRWPPSWRACRWRRSSPTCTRDLRARASRRSRSARGCRARGSAARLWRGVDRLVAMRARAGPRASTTSARARLGLPPLPWVHTRALARADDGRRRFPQLEYPRAWPPWLQRRRAAAVGAAGRATSSRRRATGPLVLVAPSTSQDRRAPLLRAALDGLADAPVRVIATWNRRCRRARDVPANAVLVAVGVLRADDAALRPRRLPRRPRHAGARAGQRLPRRRLPGGRRHGRERRARRLGRRGRAPPAPASARPGRCAWRSQRALAQPRCERASGESRSWAASTTTRRRGRRLERWAARSRR